MEKYQLDQTKDEVQKILDNHLTEEQKFSIKDFSEEATFLLIDLLLEKDDSKREKIRNKIDKKIITHKKNIEIDIEKVLEIKDKLDEQKNRMSDLADLKNLINSDAALDEQLKNI